MKQVFNESFPPATAATRGRRIVAREVRSNMVASALATLMLSCCCILLVEVCMYLVDWSIRTNIFRIVIKYFPGHYWHRRAHPQLEQRTLHRQGGGAEGELWLVETSITWSCDINTHLWLVQAPEADHFCNLTRTSVKISFPEMKRRVFVNFLGYKVTTHTTWNISSKQNYCQEPNLIHLQRCKGRCGDSVNSVACVPLRNWDTWFLQLCFDIYEYLRISTDIYSISTHRLSHF